MTREIIGFVLRFIGKVHWCPLGQKEVQGQRLTKTSRRLSKVDGVKIEPPMKGGVERQNETRSVKTGRV